MGVESLDWGTHPQRGLEGGEQQSRALIAAEMSPETGLISSGEPKKDGDQLPKGKILLHFWSLEGSRAGTGEFGMSILVPQSQLAHLER